MGGETAAPLTAAQHDTLSRYFLFCPLPDLAQRRAVADEAGLDTRKVELWFSNMRKRMNLGVFLEEETEEICDIDDIEQTIKESGICPLDYNPWSPQERGGDPDTTESAGSVTARKISTAEITVDASQISEKNRASVAAVLKQENCNSTESLSELYNNLTRNSPEAAAAEISATLPLIDLTEDSNLEENPADTADKARQYDRLKEKFALLKSQMEELSKKLALSRQAEARAMQQTWVPAPPRSACPPPPLQYYPAPPRYPQPPPYYPPPSSAHQLPLPYHPPPPQTFFYPLRTPLGPAHVPPHVPPPVYNARPV